VGGAEVRSTSGDHDRSRRLARLGLIALFACFAIDQLHALLGYGRFATDEDQTLLWFAGRELLHLHLHEPNFYGQNYNTVFEAIPGELLHLLGVSLALAACRPEGDNTLLLLTPPRPPSVSLDLAGAPLRGAPRSTVN
jgi:hypothetical protein